MEKIGFALLIATIAILGRCASLKHNLVGSGHTKHPTAHGAARHQRSHLEPVARLDRYSFVAPVQTATPEAVPEKKTEPVTSSPTPTPPIKPPKERPKEPF